MKLLSCDFEGLVINSKKVSELFEEHVLRETGREAGNWVSSDQAIWFLREITGMENAEMSWKFFIPTIKAFPVGQVEAMLMIMYDGNGVLLRECTRLVAVRYTRIGRDMSYSAVRQRYTQAPGGSLMYEMHWNELPMAGYVVMKFSDFRKAVQLQKVRRNGKAMIEILITRPDVYETIGDGRQDEGLVPLVETMAPNAEVSPSWYVRDRLRNYSGRYVVVIVDLRVHWSLVGPVFLTRRKTLAVRNEIHMGAWKAAYMYDDYTIVYHRAWDYGDLTPDRGEHKRSREEVRLNVTTTFCLRCAEMTPNGMHLCPGCALPVFYPNFIPNADESDFERCHIVPEWERSMRQFKPKRIPSEAVGVIKTNLISYSMASDLRMTVQGGIRLPPYLGEDKGGVDTAWDELAKVLFQFSYVSGISASDAFVEKWVAKHLIKTNQVDRFDSVTEYFRANPVHAAQWGRRMTTSVRKFARHDTYLSFYIPIADLRKYMVSETGYDEKKRLREAIAKVQKAISAGQSEPPAPFRDPFVYVSDERVRTVLDGRQPEPLDVNIEGLQSVHHAAQGPGPKQEPIVKGGKGKGKKGEKGGKGGSPSGPPPKSGEVPGKGSCKGDSPSVPQAKAKGDAGPAPMEVDATAAQPKKTWVAVAVEGARPSAKAKMTPVPKAEPKGKAASVSEAKSAPAPKAEAKETKQAEPKVEVKKEKVGGDDAPGGSRGSAEGQNRERKSRWDPDETVKESTKREASTRPDDVDSRPGAAAREASGDDLHSALGSRSSAKDAVAPLTASKAMAKKPEGGEIRL